MIRLPPNNPDNDWILPVRIDRVVTLSVNRNMIFTLILSVLLHLFLLWFFAPKLFSIGAPKKDAPPLEITLGPPQEKEAAPSEQVFPTPASAAQKQPKPTKPKPVKTRPPKQVKPIETPVEVVKETELVVQKNEKLDRALPQPVQPETSVEPLPGEDMQAYIRRQKEAKLAKQGHSEQDIEEVLASNNPQSAGARRDAKIKDNLNLEGTNGIFEIRYLGLHVAQFSFKGWKNNVNTARLEVIDVNAPEGVNIKSAVIKKMIEIIRREYNGDFNWDSRRLGRVLVLSARLQDNEALESFMMNEFFGPGTPVR